MGCGASDQAAAAAQTDAIIERTGEFNWTVPDGKTTLTNAANLASQTAILCSDRFELLGAQWMIFIQRTVGNSFGVYLLKPSPAPQYAFQMQLFGASVVTSRVTFV